MSTKGTAMPKLDDEQTGQIAEARAQLRSTARATSEAMEAVLYRPISVLDHGFVRVIDYMGDDSAIVQGARVSYGSGTRQTSDDRNLIRYLMRHRHTTPFELADIKLHVRAPMFVTRQWFRHRTASINEYSARYSILEREFYVPEPQNVAIQSSSNKQGRGGTANSDHAADVIHRLRDDASRAYDSYSWMLNEDGAGNPIDDTRLGVARELARITLPVSVYTQFYWKVNLWNLLHFLNLRASPHAQLEIRLYADAILGLVRDWVPLAFEAFRDYVMAGAMLSAQQITLVRQALSGELASGTPSMTRRELRELLELLPELQARVQV